MELGVVGIFDISRYDMGMVDIHKDAVDLDMMGKAKVVMGPP